MELREVAVTLIEGLLSRSTIQLLLVLVPPSLKLPDVVSKVDFGHEVFLEGFLVLREMSEVSSSYGRGKGRRKCELTRRSCE